MSNNIPPVNATTQEILAIDTSTTQINICWGMFDSISGYILDYVSYATNITSKKITHTEHIAPITNMIKEKIGSSYHNISGIITTLGPGLFNGLRASLAFTKGLHCGTRCNMMGITNTDMWAYLYSHISPLLCAIDAKSNRYFCKFFHMPTTIHHDSDVMDITVQGIIELIQQKYSLPPTSTLWCVGTAAKKLLNTIHEQSLYTSKLLHLADPTHEKLDIGRGLLEIGIKKLQHKDYIDTHTTPLYIRSAI